MLWGFVMFNPWSSKCEISIGPIDPSRELRLTPREALRYVDRVRSKRLRNSRLVERTGNLLVHQTRFNYFDGLPQIGLACGDYTDLNVLQYLKRFVLQPDVGYLMNKNTPATASVAAAAAAAVTPIVTVKHDEFVGEIDDEVGEAEVDEPEVDDVENRRETVASVDDADDDDAVNDDDDDDNNDCVGDDENDDNNSNNNNNSVEKNTTGIHSDYYRRQIPLHSMLRVLDQPIFHNTNLKNVLQSSKSARYYYVTYPLANCGRMYVLPGPMLPCFSAVLPLHALCTIFGLNVAALPRRCIVPIERTPYAYLADSLRVRYMYTFSPGISFLDRRDPVIHDGSIDTCDKLFLTDDHNSDFRINCTLNCRNRNEDYDGDTNNPSFCKGIESRTEITYNMRTHLMPLLRNRHIFSQNILFRVFVLLTVDPPYENAYALLPSRNATVIANMVDDRDNVAARRNSIEQDVYESVKVLLGWLDVDRNGAAKRRAIALFGRDVYLIYRMYLRRSLTRAYERIAAFDELIRHTAGSSSTEELAEHYIDVLMHLQDVWSASDRSPTANCFSILDNVLRSFVLVTDDPTATLFVDTLLRRVHELLPRIFTGQEPLCFVTLVNVMSTAKGNFDDVILLQRNFEKRLSLANPHNVSRSLMDLLAPIHDDVLHANKLYLDNFVDGSKKVPNNSKLAISTKWTLQNVIYHEGDLYIEGRVVLPDCFRALPYDLFFDVDVVCAIFDGLLLSEPSSSSLSTNDDAMEWSS